MAYNQNVIFTLKAKKNQNDKSHFKHKHDITYKRW